MRQINLLPKDMQSAYLKSVVVRSAAFSIGGTLLFCFCLHVLLVFGAANLEERALSPASYLDTMEFAQLREKIDGKAEEVKAYIERYGTVVESQLDNRTVSGILLTAGKSGRHKVWFTRLSLDRKAHKCEIDGRSFNTRLVSEFMLNVKKTPYFESVSLISMEKGADEKVDFKIVGTLK